MGCTIAQLRHKEVINEKDGSLLGCVDDVEIDIKTGCLVAIVLYGRPRFFGLFGKRKDIVIPWRNIRLIGEDTILVNCNIEGRPKQKYRLF
ncbi:MAG: YlmC/YmxH family sporulation protein [Clostridia bacterium]|nr:YlmC/YmxH family sporulation protein [Clostridia bacterium]